MEPLDKGSTNPSSPRRKRTDARRRRNGRVLATDLEGALRRETRQRRQAERVVRKQSEALAKTLELLARSPALPDFIGAVLRSITRQCGGLWTTFWVLDERTGEGRREWFEWRDESVGRTVEAFAGKHALLMRRLARLYSDLIRANGVTMLVPSADPRVPPVVRRFYRSIGATGALLVPLKLGSRLIGWISHQRAESGLEIDQVAFMEGMAQQAALAFQLTQLSKASHDAECALEEERIAREQKQELIAINRLLHVTASDPADRSGGVLRGSLENMTELLLGRWASLWRNSDVAGFAVPAWIGSAGNFARVPADAALDIAGACRSAHRARFEKWLSAQDMQAGAIHSRRMQNLLAAMGAPSPGGRAARLIHVPLRFDDESLGFMLVLAEDPPDKTSERHVAVKALSMQAALALALGEMSAVQRAAGLAEERNRIARDLHDLLAQAFTGIVLQVEAMRAECPGLPGAVASRLEKIREQAGRSSEELRRTLSMLRPTALDQCTLPEALAILARETESRSGVRVRFKNRAETLQFAPRAEQHLLAIVTESLQNALTHAAPTQISIQLEVVKLRLVVRVVNDGHPPGPTAAAASSGHRMGLASIRERAVEIGAAFSLRTLRLHTRMEIAAPLDRLIVNGNS